MSITTSLGAIDTRDFEDACEAFADAPGRKSDASLSGIDSAREVPYAALPEGSKDWYRQRMTAALETLGIPVVPTSPDA